MVPRHIMEASIPVRASSSREAPLSPKAGLFCFSGFARPRFTPGGLFGNSRHMSEPADDEFKLLLAQAFDRAWKRYYRPSRVGAISESVARPALAKHLVALAKKEGIVSLGALGEAGLLHLLSLTPEAQRWGHLRIKGARARFQPVLRVRLTVAAGSFSGKPSAASR
jgi:hypothetical protein